MGLEWWKGGRVEQPIHFAHLPPSFSVILPLLFAVPGELLLQPPPRRTRAHGWSASADISPSLPPSFYRPLWTAAGSFSVFAAAGYRAIKVSQQLSTGWASDLEVETKGLFRPSCDRDHNSMHLRNHMYSGSQADVGDGKHLVGNRGM